MNLDFDNGVIITKDNDEVSQEYVLGAVREVLESFDGDIHVLAFLYTAHNTLWAYTATGANVEFEKQNGHWRILKRGA